jgi:hypothetical protein
MRGVEGTAADAAHGGPCRWLQNDSLLRPAQRTGDMRNAHKLHRFTIALLFAASALNHGMDHTWTNLFFPASEAFR